MDWAWEILLSVTKPALGVWEKMMHSPACITAVWQSVEWNPHGRKTILRHKFSRSYHAMNIIHFTILRPPVKSNFSLRAQFLPKMAFLWMSFIAQVVHTVNSWCDMNNVEHGQISYLWQKSYLLLNIVFVDFDYTLITSLLGLWCYIANLFFLNVR